VTRDSARSGNPAGALADLAAGWRSASRRDIALGLARFLATLSGVRAVRVTIADPADPVEVTEPPGADGDDVPLGASAGVEVSVARGGRRMAAGDEALARLAIEQAALALEAARLRGRIEANARTRDEFVSAFGHELRDRLAPIFTSLTLLKMGEGKPEAHRQVIERQVAHLAHLVNDLIDVTYVARGELRIKREPVDLATVVQGALALAQPLIGERAGQAPRVPRGSLFAVGDRQRLAQALAILLTRSVRPGGGAVPAVEARQAGDRVQLRLAGAAPLALEGAAAFDRLASPTFTRDGSLATALGMTLVRGLVDLHGGVIAADGDDLVIELPAHAGRERPRTVVPPAFTSGHPAGLRVLVVDDNVDAADTLATALRASGLEAHAVYGAVEALELVEARPFEVAVLDIGLPLMDGYELARRLRRVSHRDDMCLFALTGYGEAADAARSQAAGFRRHFVKPIQLGTLLAAIVQDVSRGPRGQA
jgi:CheY-like chemotaxis protein/signal transduction histidine kinase